MELTLPQSAPPGMYETTLAALGSSTNPPPFPEPRVYTAAYCEENVYHLLKTLATQQPLWRGLAVFVSNPSKSVSFLMATPQ